MEHLTEQEFIDALTMLTIGVLTKKLGGEVIITYNDMRDMVENYRFKSERISPDQSRLTVEPLVKGSC